MAYAPLLLLACNTHTLLQVLASTPLLEELSLSGCSQLGSGVLVSASRPARLPPAVLGEYEAQLLLEHRGPQHLEGVEESREEAAERLRFPTKGLSLPQVWLAGGLPAGQQCLSIEAVLSSFRSMSDLGACVKPPRPPAVSPPPCLCSFARWTSQAQPPTTACCSGWRSTAAAACRSFC